jgi:hypothetical protein
VWAVGALKEYGIIGTDEEVMLWPKNMPEDLEIFEHQYLRFKQVDWKKDDVFDWFSAYLIIKSAMYEPKDMTSYAHQVGVKFQVKALLDLIVKQEKQIAYEKIS